MTPPPARFGPFTFDPETGRLTRDGLPLDLAPHQAGILAALVAEAGQVVPYEALEPGSGAAASDAVRTAVRTIRAILRDPADRPVYIETVRGRGYRFVAPVVRGNPAGGVAASPEVVRWISDDIVAIRTLTYSSLALGGGALLIDWRLLPLALAPALLRLAFRWREGVRLADGDLTLDEWTAANRWAETLAPAPPPRGWRRALVRIRNGACAAAVAGVALVQSAVLARIWDRPPWIQSLFDRVFVVTGWAAIVALVALVAAAIASPAPPFERLTLALAGRWRALVGRVLESRLRERSPSLVAARREVDALLHSPQAER